MEGAMRTTTIGWVLGLGLAAGGGGGGDPAADECHALFNLACDRFVECGVDGATSHDVCIDMIETTVDCDEADQVGATYASCIATLETAACADLWDGVTVALPPDCTSVILFE
jgi:hypothetical protein